MTDDVTSDPCFIVRQHGTEWILYDTDHITMKTTSMNSMIAFVHGLWRGMSIHGKVDLTCAFYNSRGVLIDTLVSGELIGKDEKQGYI